MNGATTFQADSGTDAATSSTLGGFFRDLIVPYLQGGCSALAGLSGGLASFWDMLDRWTLQLEQATGGRSNRSGLFEQMAKDQQAWEAYFGARGLDPHAGRGVAVLHWLCRAIGSAPFDVATIAPMTLPAHSAMHGGAAAARSSGSAAEGAALGLFHGLLLHQILLALRFLPVPARLGASAFVFGGLSLLEEMQKPAEARDYEKSIADFLVGAGLAGSAGPGKNPTDLARELRTAHGPRVQRAAAEVKSALEQGPSGLEPGPTPTWLGPLANERGAIQVGGFFERLRARFGGSDAAAEATAASPVGQRAILPQRELGFERLRRLPTGSRYDHALLVVELVPRGASSPQRIAGLVSDRGGTSCTIRELGTGRAVEIDPSTVTSAFVRPLYSTSEPGSKPSGAPSWNSGKGLALAVSRTREPYGLLEYTPRVFAKQSTRCLFGQLAVRETGDGSVLIELRDQAGRLHVIDSSLATFSLQVMSGCPDTALIQVLHDATTSRAQPVQLIDRTGAARATLAAELFAKREIHGEPALHEHLSRDIAETRRLLLRWYPDQAPRLIRDVETSLGTAYVPLLVEPGVASRADKLVGFGKAYLQAHPNATPWELRQAFSQDLGNETLYRGMVLSEAEAIAVGRDGILAPGLLRDPGVGQSRLSASLDSKDRVERRAPMTPLPPARSPRQEIAARIAGGYDRHHSMMISTSRYQEVARSVGFWESGRVPLRGGDKLYVYEMQIPKIETVEQLGLFAGIAGSGGDNLHLAIGPFVKRWNDPGVEVFVPYRIDPRYVTSVRTTSATPVRPLGL